MTFTLPFTVPPSTHVAGDAGFPADIDSLYNAVAGLAGYNVCDAQWAGGADPTGTADSTAAWQAAVAAANTAGGGRVVVPPGTYLLSGPVNVGPYTLLEGQGPAMSLGIGTPPVPVAPRVIAASSWAPSSATGVIQILSQTPGGWATTAQQQGVRNLIIDCSGNASANLNPILMTGPCYDTHLTGLFLYGGHDGIQATGFTESGIAPTLPYHQRWTAVTAAETTFRGFVMANMTDSTFIDCLAFGCADVGWFIQGPANSQFIGCRAEWNGNHGFEVSGSVRSSVIFMGCSTDQNAGDGFFASAALVGTTDGANIVISGCKFHADRGVAGIVISGSTVPVTVTGTVTETGLNTATYYPVTGMKVTTSTAVTVSGCTLQADVTPWSWDGQGAVSRTAVNYVTGDVGSQVATTDVITSPAGSTVSTTAETLIGSFAIPAGQPAGATYKIRLWGTFASGATAGTHTLRTRIGGLAGTVIASMTTASWAISATGTWSAETVIQLQTAGASGTWTGDLRYQATGGAVNSNIGTAGSGVKDSTVAESFAVTIQLSSATSSLVVSGGIAKRQA